MMIRSLKFYRKIYTEFVRMDIKRIMMYPIDFVLGNMGFFLETISTLFVLYIIVMNTGFLGEFSGYEVLFFYSYLMLVNALWEIFFVTVLEIPYMIQSGELDIFLVRPLNILFQFIIFQLDEESVFETVVALLLLIGSITQLSGLWTLSSLLNYFSLYFLLFLLDMLFIYF